MDGPETGDAKKDGEDPLQDKDPGPPRTTSKPVHLFDRGREQATKGARDSSCGEEDGGADTKLGAFVPAREIIVDSWEEAGFSETKKPTGGHQARPILNKAHEGHGKAPNNPVHISN